MSHWSMANEYRSTLSVPSVTIISDDGITFEQYSVLQVNFLRDTYDSLSSACFSVVLGMVEIVNDVLPLSLSAVCNIPLHRTK